VVTRDIGQAGQESSPGFANFEAPIGGKWLELLKEISPQTKRVGFLRHPAVNAHTEFLVAAQASAPSFGQEVVRYRSPIWRKLKRGFRIFAAAERERRCRCASHALTVGASGVITELARVISYRACMATYFHRAGACCRSAQSVRSATGAPRTTFARILDGEMKAGELPVRFSSSTK